MNILQDIFSINMKRGTAFMQVSFILYGIVFAVIAVQIIFLKAAIENLGGILFVVYAFFDFLVVYFLCVNALTPGAFANKVDIYYMELMVRIMTNINETRELAVRKVFYESKDGNIDILKVQENGHYKSDLNDKVYTQEYMDTLIDINQEILDQLDRTEEKVVFVTEQIDYRMGYGQLKFFGAPIDYDTVGSYVNTLVSVIVLLS